MSPSSPSLVPIVQELSDISAAHYQETVFKSEDRKTTKLFFCAGGGCGFCGMVDGVPMRLGCRLVFAFYLSLYLYLFLLLFVAIAYLYHDYSDCHGCSDYYCVDPVFGEKSEL